MRDALENIWKQKRRLSGTFVKFGIKSGKHYNPRLTVLLSDISDEYGTYLCEHIWINESKDFMPLNLSPGDRVELNGTVNMYKKGYRGERNTELAYAKPIKWDYSISEPCYVKKVYYEPQDYDY